MSEIRDWQPGDGVGCSFRRSAAFACGPPVKTRVIRYEPVGRRQHSTRKQPLCATHAAAGEETRSASATVRRQAVDRLIVAHWDEYQQLLTEASEVAP